MDVTVREVAEADYPAWKDLWEQYLVFYETELPPEHTDALAGTIDWATCRPYRLSDRAANRSARGPQSARGTEARRVFVSVMPDGL